MVKRTENFFFILSY